MILRIIIAAVAGFIAGTTLGIVMNSGFVAFTVSFITTQLVYRSLE